MQLLILEMGLDFYDWIMFFLWVIPSIGAPFPGHPRSSAKANSTVGLVGLLGVLVDLLNNLNTSTSENQWKEVTTG